VPEQPGQGGQRLVRQIRRLEQPRHHPPGKLGSLARVPVRPLLDALGADPAEPGIKLGVVGGPGQPSLHERGALGLPAAHADPQLLRRDREFDRGTAGVVSGPLVRPHHGRPGEQVRVGRNGVRGGEGPGVGVESRAPRARVRADDPRRVRACADLRVPLHPGEGEQPPERSGDGQVPFRGLGRAARQCTPEELLQPKQRDRLQATAAGEQAERRPRVIGDSGVLTSESLQCLRLSHHAVSLPHTGGRR
jgi:hypothetical protein